MGPTYDIYFYDSRGKRTASGDKGSLSYIEREIPRTCGDGETFRAVAIGAAPRDLQVIAGDSRGIEFRGSLERWREYNRPLEEPSD